MFQVAAVDLRFFFLSLNGCSPVMDSCAVWRGRGDLSGEVRERRDLKRQGREVRSSLSEEDRGFVSRGDGPPPPSDGPPAEMGAPLFWFWVEIGAQDSREAETSRGRAAARHTTPRRDAMSHKDD
ncbi:hypothetical protein MRB53_026270 [Persea americana]|uniref:Uncharacterized protein n=1 Tax=Persea americana TaxID=3435 RepID=A0ACC2LHP7_PERAE|nr:hypothetical protein MRB53_026270 [Persea americana]